MDKTSGAILSLGSALIGALVAPFLVGAVGFAICRLVAWMTGNPRDMEWMWLVYVLAMLSAPAAFVAIGMTWVRGFERRERERDRPAPRGFPAVPAVRDEGRDDGVR